LIGLGLVISLGRVAGDGSSAVTVGSEFTVDMMDLSDAGEAVLVVAIGRWNDSALAEVYRRHGGAVYGLARRVLGSDGRAEEVTQDVFVDLWRRPERFDPARGSLRSFLLTIAHGRSVDVLRSDRSRAAREERHSRKTAAGGYDLESQVLDLAVADRVKGVVAALPVAERQVIELAYFGGHTYREVAALLSEAEGTVKGRIRRGLRRMRDALAEEMGPAWTHA
jgi:RNA polymerase sigma-70 factor, ECF subfamily